MKLDKFEPAGSRILLELIPDAKMHGEIILPDSATMLQYQEGIVVRGMIGCYEKGEHLLFTRSTGREIEFDGQDKETEYVLVDIDDIAGGYDLKHSLVADGGF